jgi:hypothetical protein
LRRGARMAASGSGIAWFGRIPFRPKTQHPDRMKSAFFTDD